MATPPPVLTLAVKKGPREGETRQCRAGAALRVGRVVTGNDLALRDVGTSQRHLAIEFLPPPAARWAVSDLGSSNGTLLNGAPIVPTVPATLSHGDLIKIGESTVLAVSIASDSDPNPDAKPAPRRTSRHSAAAVEEKPPVVTRRGGRKKAAAPAEPPNAENEEPDAAAVVEEAEKPPVVTRRGGRKKAAAAEPPEEGKEEREEAAEATRRGGRKKAAEPPEADKEEREEAAVVTCRGERKKAAEPPEADQQQEEEAAVVTRRGGRKKVAATAAPPLPPNTRSGRGRGRVTRASARKAFLEEEDEEEQEGEVAAPIERRGDQARVVAANGGGDGEEEDRVEAGDGEVEGTAKASEEEVPVARGAATAAPPLPPNTRSRRGRGRLTRASARKAVLEEEDEEQEEVTAPIERRGDQARVAAANGGGGEEVHKVAVGDGGVEGTAKASEEEVPVARRGRPWREPKGRGNAPQCADSDNEGEEGKGGAEEEEDGKGEVIGSEGDVGDGEKVERAGRSSLETMTLREWFERMEKYLPRMINEAADEMIAALQERHRLVNEYISTLGESSDPA